MLKLLHCVMAERTVSPNITTDILRLVRTYDTTTLRDSKHALSYALL